MAVCIAVVNTGYRWRDPLFLFILEDFFSPPPYLAEAKSSQIHSNKYFSGAPGLKSGGEVQLGLRILSDNISWAVEAGTSWLWLWAQVLLLGWLPIPCMVTASWPISKGRNRTLQLRLEAATVRSSQTSFPSKQLFFSSMKNQGCSMLVPATGHHWAMLKHSICHENCLP